MSKKELPSPELLRQLLRYEPDTGKLYWKERTSNRVKVGDQAGTVAANGYIVISIFNKLFYAHRIAFAIFYKKWPTLSIDHKDGIKTNNSIKNLREAGNLQNARNCSLQKNSNKFGLGVRFKNNKWLARIMVNYKEIHLGTFDSLDDAIAARKAAEAKYGFHPNHGRR